MAATFPKRRILFVCIHNSARSQMAEAFLRAYGGAWFEAESAGLEPGTLNPTVVEAMARAGIDISANRTQSVLDVYHSGKSFDAVITVCDQASAERCPVFPGRTKKIAWSFRDPSSFQGSQLDKLNQTTVVREEIREKVLDFIREAKQDAYWM